MEQIVKNYIVTIVREAGASPVTGEWMERGEETLVIEAESQQSAYKKSLFKTQLSFRGQVRKTFINGEEYLDEMY